MLELPVALRQACERAYEFMIHHPTHDLYPQYRLWIYRALGSKGDVQTYRVRLTLSLLVVRSILPIWYTERPTNPWPEQVIALAEGVLQGTLSREVVNPMIENSDFLVTQSPWEIFDSPEAVPLSAAAEGVAWAVGELPFEVAGSYRFDGPTAIDTIYPNNLSDAQETDPWGADLVLWAMCAYTNSSWIEQANPEKRRAFWTWWLKEAIPAAWNMAHTLSP